MNNMSDFPRSALAAASVPPSRLQRLLYPSEPNGFAQAFLSAAKRRAVSDFFACGKMPPDQFKNGDTERSLDVLYGYVQIKKTGCRTIHAHTTSPLTGDKTPITLYLWGPRTILESYGHQLTRSINGGNRHAGTTDVTAMIFARTLAAQPPVPESDRDVHYEFLLRSGLMGQDRTMGWFDLDNAMFIMPTMNTLNKVRELFGQRPHVSNRKQKDNFPPPVPEVA